MKKRNFLFALAATCVLGMNAQSTETPLITGVNFSVEGQQPALNPFWSDGDSEEDKYLPDTYSINLTSNIDLEFVGYNANEMTSTLGYHPYVMLATGNGFAMNTTFYTLEGCEVNNNTSQYAFPLDKAKWGDPYMGAYYATPMVCFLKRTEGELPPVITQQQMAEDDALAESIVYYMYNEEPVFFQTPTYTTPNTSPASLVSVYPNNNWEDETFADAYNRGDIRFTFTNPVSFEDKSAIGIVEYSMADGSDADIVILEIGTNAEEGWNPMDGYYVVSANYSLEGVSANEIKEITITLFDMKSEGETISIDSVILENDNINVQRLAKQNKKTKIGESMVANPDNVNVYNISGVLVKGNIPMSEVTNLPAGLYIVNGKTIVVR